MHFQNANKKFKEYITYKPNNLLKKVLFYTFTIVPFGTFNYISNNCLSIESHSVSNQDPAFEWTQEDWLKNYNIELKPIMKDDSLNEFLLQSIYERYLLPEEVYVLDSSGLLVNKEGVPLRWISNLPAKFFPNCTEYEKDTDCVKGLGLIPYNYETKQNPKVIMAAPSMTKLNPKLYVLARATHMASDGWCLPQFNLNINNPVIHYFTLKPFPLSMLNDHQRQLLRRNKEGFIVNKWGACVFISYNESSKRYEITLCTNSRSRQKITADAALLYGIQNLCDKSEKPKKSEIATCAGGKGTGSNYPSDSVFVEKYSPPKFLFRPSVVLKRFKESYIPEKLTTLFPIELRKMSGKLPPEEGNSYPSNDAFLQDVIFASVRNLQQYASEKCLRNVQEIVNNILNLSIKRYNYDKLKIAKIRDCIDVLLNIHIQVAGRLGLNKLATALESEPLSFYCQLALKRCDLHNSCPSTKEYTRFISPNTPETFEMPS